MHYRFSHFIRDTPDDDLYNNYTATDPTFKKGKQLLAIVTHSVERLQYKSMITVKLSNFQNERQEI